MEIWKEKWREWIEEKVDGIKTVGGDFNAKTGEKGGKVY